MNRWWRMERIPATRPTNRAAYVRLLFVIALQVFTKTHHKECQTHYLNRHRHIAFDQTHAHVATKYGRNNRCGYEKDATNSVVDIWRICGHFVV